MMPDTVWVRTLAFCALLPTLALAQSGFGLPPSRLASGWSLPGLEDKCSVEGMNFDPPCMKAIKMDLGAAPVVFVQRLPNGGEQETMKYMDPDVPRATALMEQACGYQHWESCMLYSSLLEQGGRIPKDLAHARAIDQWACAQGFQRACEWLKEQHVPLEKHVQNPVLRWTGFERGPPKLPKAIPQKEPELPKESTPPKNNAAGAAPVAKVDGSDYRRLCFEKQNLYACKALGKFILAGKIDPASPHEAKDALRAACLGGLKETCE